MTQDAALAVLVIEGSGGDHPSFAKELEDKGCLVTRATSGSAGLKVLDAVNPNVVVVDAASLRTSGVRICQSYRMQDEHLPLILIVTNKTSLPEVVDANLILRLPFTVQKLFNRLIAFQPTDDKYVVKAGPIELNTQTHLVACNGRLTKLTPRLVEILRILMEHSGEVVERDPLFTKVWQTDYIGDTRTLDVHISWLRQALEEDPSQPEFIRTERGVGYILKI